VWKLSWHAEFCHRSIEPKSGVELNGMTSSQEELSEAFLLVHRLLRGCFLQLRRSFHFMASYHFFFDSAALFSSSHQGISVHIPLD
jgi:hypothetical protein